MQAITCTAFSRDSLDGLTVGEHPNPTSKPGWETVEVMATSLNHHDVWSLRGVGLDASQLPIVLGCDAAGIASDGRDVVVHAVISEAIGADDTQTSQFSILSERFDGTFAERVAVPSRNLVDMPQDLSYEEAACMPTAYLTAYRALISRGGLRPGQRLLIQGAGGGASTASALLGLALGAEVFVTSRDRSKLERALELGVHEVLMTGERLPSRVDVVLESVGSATWEHSLKSTANGGKVVCIGATSGANPPALLNHIFYRQVAVIGSTMGTLSELQALLNFARVSGVRPVIDEEYRFSEAHRAFQRMINGEVFGKLVLVPDGIASGGTKEVEVRS